jgi:hypothetical protein
MSDSVPAISRQRRIKTMKRVRIIGLALVAVFAFSAVAAASASAFTEFVAEPLGGTFGGKALNTQVFTVKAGKTECTKATPKGEVKALKAEKEVIKVVYEGCKALGQKTKISEAEYEFNAKTGSVAVKNNITITVEELGFNCTVKVGPVGNETLEKIEYANNGKKLKAKANVAGITYTTSGGFCGEGAKTGTYTGEVEAEVNAGAGLINAM